MIFSERVMLTINAAPRGWPEKLSLESFVVLDDERKRYYEPVFAKYRTKKIRDYDLDCGHFIGWRPIQVGLGEPIGYEYVGYYKAKYIDTLLNSNVIMSRVLR